MKNMVWWVLQLKVIDYVETCLFVLRKKQSQVSNLHVFHHISNLMFAWFGLRHFPEMRGTFCTLINCFIHVIMYIYYLLAACSPKIQRMIAPIKPYITIMQMASCIIIFFITKFYFLHYLIVLLELYFNFCLIVNGAYILFCFSHFLFLESGAISCDVDIYVANLGSPLCCIPTNKPRDCIHVWWQFINISIFVL